MTQRNVLPAISKTMRIAEILAILPESEKLLAQYGLSCFNCSANETEVLIDGCLSHGFSDEDIDDLVKDLNTLLHDRPARPQTLTVTKEAAEALKEILLKQGGLEQFLRVDADERGGFCMEFAQTADGTSVFTNDAVADVRLCATPLTLSRIGGATIDYREERFALDLPEDKKSGCACAHGGECGC